MAWIVTLPETSAQYRVFADTFLIWCLMSYARPDNTLVLNSSRPAFAKGDTPKVNLLVTIFSGAVTLAWTWPSGSAIPLSLLVAATGLIVPAFRREFSRRRYLTPLPLFELITPWICGSLIAVVIGGFAHWHFQDWCSVSFDESTRIRMPLTIAAALLVTRGGTHFVKAVCATGKILPRISEAPSAASSPDTQVDEVRLGMGRKLGNLERILMLIFVMAGRYDAVGFVLAAKGLIRSKEFEDRDFTEYFLLGSLASILIAILTGEALNALVAAARST
ncbi:MAG: hypothetical protein KDA96_23940 [Planctomycetaceae bacterium]|nr:hypothetical protein [Planctomycetaceae bacterium]MCA9066149.1 hypothetical protein [Planctomycetaceae bacterium]